ncbi:MAG TPA: hypothetical protein VEZ12_04635, partial [Herpetosiphonaceae bacterium]|nr:hypothetical protein [Herpetosiphonaceae bacterium]
MIALVIFTYSFALWLGFYLLARDIRKALLRRTALGLITYALALAADLLARTAQQDSLSGVFIAFHSLLIFVPPLFWTGALIHLLPEELPWRGPLDRLWAYGLFPIVTIAAVATVMIGSFAAGAPGDLLSRPSYLALAMLVLMPLAIGVALVMRSHRALRPRNPLTLLLVATLFFGLGIALLALPIAWPPHRWKVLAIAPDLLVLGIAIAILDAFDEGETLLPDITRSFAAASFLALLFGLQVALLLGEGFDLR